MENYETNTRTIDKTESIEPNIRQQDKIISYLTYHDKNIFGQGEVRASFSDRQNVFEDIRSGEVDEDSFKDVLMSIASPMDYENDKDNPIIVYSKIEENNQIKKIIANFAKGDMTLYDDVDASDLGTFYKMFPEPSSFRDASEPFINDLSEVNNDAKIKEYRNSLNEFQKNVYGKRFEYFNQIEILKDEAYGDEILLDLPEIEESMIEKQDDYKIESLGWKESQEILSRAVINGSSYKEKLLTTEMLFSAGLAPHYKINMGDSVICFPSCGYEISNGRIAITAYVEKQGKVTVNSYYRSNSQGVWRYLPDYKTDEVGDINWYGKGHSEESATLPIVLQKTLSEITKDQSSVLKLNSDPNVIFAGTAFAYGHRMGDYYKEVDKEPKKLDKQANFNVYQGADKKAPPEQVELSPNESPDFGNLLATWKQTTSLYGDVTIESFPSKDGKLKFMFCRDRFNRAWIGDIENSSSIQSNGLRESWIAGGDLATPAYEYKYERPERSVDMTGGYGNDNMKNGAYVDMFENYLSKIPVIKEYLESNVFNDKLETQVPLDNSANIIDSSSNFEDLYKNIKRLGGVYGSQKFYKADELIDIIEKFKQGKAGIMDITNGTGIRAKVLGIMEIEKAENETRAIAV